MTVRDVWEKYQEGKSEQQEFIPQSKVLSLIRKARIKKEDNVLVVANSEIYTTLLDQLSHGLTHYNTLTFATDIEALHNKSDVIPVKFSELSLSDLVSGYDKVLGFAPFTAATSVYPNTIVEIWGQDFFQS